MCEGFNEKSKEAYSFSALFFSTKKVLTPDEAKKEGKLKKEFSIKFPVSEYSRILQGIENCKAANPHLNWR